MDDGKRKIRICMIGIVLAAVVIGICYYYNRGGNQPNTTEGTLIRQERADTCYGC